MSLLKYAVLGAAVAYGVKYLTKKGIDGKSVIDNLKDKAPEYADKVKAAADQYVSEVSQKVKDTVSEYKQTANA